MFFVQRPLPIRIVVLQLKKLARRAYLTPLPLHNSSSAPHLLRTICKIIRISASSHRVLNATAGSRYSGV